MDFLEWMARPLLQLARFLLWLAWDFLFHIVAWAVGWPVVRVLTFGHFPRAGLREYEESGVLEAIVVCGAGLLLLAAVVGFLSMRVVGH